MRLSETRPESKTEIDNWFLKPSQPQRSYQGNESKTLSETRSDHIQHLKHGQTVKKTTYLKQDQTMSNI